MRLTVLADNNTLIDSYYVGEPAVSYYIEDNDDKVLLDVGYSDVFMQNAAALGLDLHNVKTICLSHGHNDHTRGLKYLQQGGYLRNTEIIAHPDLFEPRSYQDLEIGAPFTKKEMQDFCKLTLSKKPVPITPNLIYLGEIPATVAFEPRRQIGTIVTNGQIQPDYVYDDSALVYQSKQGLFIITGCSHSGICNIAEYAKKVCNDSRLYGVIGGFHLFRDDARLRQTITYFQDNHVSALFPAHCVSLKAKSIMFNSLDIQEVGVGVVIDVE